MRAHGSAVYRYAWALADVPDEADDLVQDAFLLLWTRRREIAIPGDSVLPWLLVTTRHLAFNANRGNRRRRTSGLDTVADLAVETAGSEQLSWVREELSRLNPIDRALIDRCLVRGESYSEASGALGISETVARKRVQRARTRLQEARLATGNGEGR